MQILMLAQTTAASGQVSGFGWPVFVLGGLFALILLLIYPAFVLRKYVKIMIHIMDDRAVGENGHSEYFALEGEELNFRAVDGHQLAGIVMHGDHGGHPKGMIVFAHEFGNDRSSCVRYAKPLLQHGYDVFAFDFRGHGASPPEQGYRPRQWPSDRERADMLGAIAIIGSWLEQRGRSRDLGLFGISRGAGAAILASTNIDSVKAIVTDGVFSSDSTMEFLMRRFATIFAKIRIVAENHPPMFWRFLRWLLFRECRRKFGCQFPSVRKAIVKLHRKPIFFIHGERDSYIPIAQSQALYNIAKGPKYLWIVAGAAHNRSIVVSPQEYGRRVCRFFDEYLRGVTVAEEPVAGEIASDALAGVEEEGRGHKLTGLPATASEPMVVDRVGMEPIAFESLPGDELASPMESVVQRSSDKGA
ncbi:MAG: alpha/beta hydrolase [Phycisphaerae bacterium]